MACAAASWGRLTLIPLLCPAFSCVVWCALGFTSIVPPLLVVHFTGRTEQTPIDLQILRGTCIIPDFRDVCAR